MEIVFFGSGKFAVESLAKIYEAGHKIKLVVTQPDKPKGRHLFYYPTEVKVRAEELKLNVYQPSDPNLPEVVENISQKSADLFIVASYGQILKNSILKLPGLYPVNIHASLLPKYRGAAPINWAIIKGEKETGITVIRMNEIMDAGDILLQKRLEILDEDNAQTLEAKLAAVSAQAIIEAIKLIERGQADFQPQDERNMTLAPKLTKNDGLIDWNQGAAEILNKIRGLTPWPGAFTYWKGNLLKVRGARISKKTNGAPGEIIEITKGSLIVAAKNGSLEILELQMESEKRMTLKAFLCGHRLNGGERLG